MRGGGSLCQLAAPQRSGRVHTAHCAFIGTCLHRGAGCAQGATLLGPHACASYDGPSPGPPRTFPDLSPAPMSPCPPARGLQDPGAREGQGRQALQHPAPRRDGLRGARQGGALHQGSPGRALRATRHQRGCRGPLPGGRGQGTGLRRPRAFPSGASALWEILPVGEPANLCVLT